MNSLRELHRLQSAVFEVIEATLPYRFQGFGEGFIEPGILAGEEALGAEVLGGGDLGGVGGDVEIVEEVIMTWLLASLRISRSGSNVAGACCW